MSYIGRKLDELYAACAAPTKHEADIKRYEWDMTHVNEVAHLVEQTHGNPDTETARYMALHPTMVQRLGNRALVLRSTDHFSLLSGSLSLNFGIVAAVSHDKGTALAALAAAFVSVCGYTYTYFQYRKIRKEMDNAVHPKPPEKTDGSMMLQQA